jgi:aspartate kinase
MSVLVQKYGGTSLATTSRITEAARKVARAREAGYDLIVVVSAMGHSTDELLTLAGEVSEEPGARELDMLLTAGERISMSLMAMALQSLGHDAISFTGSQSGIITDALHMGARIIDVRGSRIAEELERGRVVIVAGFQGVSLSREVTTLGRGGSDTTAVALAAAFRAERCDILTDVTGVFTADPRVVAGARHISEVSFEEMSEMASLGAGVLHLRCVEIARHYGVPLRVASTFIEGAGTMIVERHMGEVPVRAVTHERGLAEVTWRGLPAGGAAAARVLEALAGRGVVARHMAEGSSGHETGELWIMVTREALGKALAAADLLMKSDPAIPAAWGRDGLGAVSIVGHGVASAPDTRGRVLATLTGAGIKVEGVFSSPLTMTCIVGEAAVDHAVRALHDAFLGAVPAEGA